MHLKLLASLSLLFLASVSLCGQSARRGLYLDGNAPALQYDHVKAPYFGAYLPFAREGGTIERWKSSLSPVGYFVSSRLLIGVRFDYQHATQLLPYSEVRTLEADSRSAIRPFVRYYLGDGSRNWDVYGELGFGRIGLKGYTGVETDFHLAAGTEVRLGGGLLANARLAYNAYASDLNYTTLDIGQRVLVRELGGGIEPRLRRGAVYLSGKVFGGSVGHMRRQGADWLQYSFVVRPTVGYFLLDGLALMAELNWRVEGDYDHVRPYWQSRHSGNGVETEFLGLLGVRYYPLGGSRLQPFTEANIGHYRYESDPEHPDAFVQTARGTAYRGGVGVAYFLSDRVSFEVLARYRTQREAVELNPWWSRVGQVTNKGFSGQLGFAFQLVD